jgi:uncharacterized protein (TIGR02145 family)
MLLKNLWCGKMSLRGCVVSAAVSGLLLLAACDEDSGTSAPNDNGISSSEEIQSSSSSLKVESSSSVILSGDGHEESSRSSSLNLKTISSSSKQLNSSSSYKPSSSLSLIVSSSSKQMSSSSSLISSSSSSSQKVGLSSSVILSGDSHEESSSSLSAELNCSMRLEWGTDRSWNFPKECRFNPEIAYDSITDSRDGQIYKIVKIGNQVWMAENLNYADSATTLSLKDRSWCYGNNPENCALAGRLYTWAAAIDSVKLATDKDNPQDCGYEKSCALPDTVYGICPPGWHLPKYQEWKTLFNEVGGDSIAAKMLKSQAGWRYNNYNNGSSGNGTDAFGFSALPAGGRYYDGNFDRDGNNAHFWTSTEYDSYNAYDVLLLYEYDNVHQSLNKYEGFSIRCLKN